MCSTDKCSLPHSVRNGVGNLSICTEGLPAMMERMGRLVCLRRCTNNSISVPKLADLLVLLFRFGLAWHTVSSNHSISAFLEHHHNKASNHPIISKLVHDFYLW